MRFLHVLFCSVLVWETELWLTCSVRFGQNSKTLLRSVTIVPVCKMIMIKLDYGRPMKPFFHQKPKLLGLGRQFGQIKDQIILATDRGILWNPEICQEPPTCGQDGLVLLRHLGYFWPIYQLPFWYSGSLVHVFNQSNIISTKTKSLYPNPK
jgi:hypothetical protein